MIEREKEIRAAEFKMGYLVALKDVFDVLTEFHHVKKEYDRHLIDRIWKKIKYLEIKKRGGST